jgi:hypothetical protein
MQVYIKLKQAGKRRLILEKQAIDIEDISPTPTLRTLITAIVTQQVAAYNAKTLDEPIISFLTKNQINDAAATGKVGFGTIYNDKKADLNQAIKVALEAHIDGLFVVAVDDKIVEKLDTIVDVNDNSVVIFLRLTLLIGR